MEPEETDRLGDFGGSAVTQAEAPDAGSRRAPAEQGFAAEHVGGTASPLAERRT